MKHRSPDGVGRVVGRGVAEGYLAGDELARIAKEGLAPLPVDGRRVLVIIPDGTRTMPMPLMFETLERELGPRVTALDYLVALARYSYAREQLGGSRQLSPRQVTPAYLHPRWDARPSQDRRNPRSRHP